MQLDHLAITCADLATGTAWAEDQLGVTMLPGGKHTRFGTHNTLLGLADGLYLEVIAPDPDARIDGPRWFGLDHPPAVPRLGNWIVRVDDIDAALATAPDGCGAPVPLERADLRWRIAVPEDGTLPMDGAFPTLIEWAAGVTPPGQSLGGAEVRLQQLTLHTPEAGALRRMCDPLAMAADLSFVQAEAVRFEATFQTPGGLRTLT